MKSLRFFLATLPLLALLFTTPSFAQQSNSAMQSDWPADKRHNEFNLGSKHLGIQGYDPVAYFSGKPTKGSPIISSEYKGVTYHFANTENKRLFDENPTQYEPAFGGWCAWAMAEEGDKVKVDPKSYKIVDGRLFLYYNGFWGDTLKQWNERGAEAEKQLTTSADANWRKLTE